MPEFYMTLLDFVPNSNFLPNGDMEANSYWAGSGDSSSHSYVTNYKVDGLRSMKFQYESLISQDFTFYTFVDCTGGKVTVDADTIFINDVNRDDGGFKVYKDYGSNYFGDDLQIQFEFQYIASDTEGAFHFFLSNDTGYRDFPSGDEIQVEFKNYGGNLRMNLLHDDKKKTYQETLPSSGTRYYLTLSKGSGLVQLSIYSDAYRTNMLGSKSTAVRSVDHRYLFGASISYNKWSYSSFTAKIENLYFDNIPAQPYLYHKDGGVQLEVGTPYYFEFWILAEQAGQSLKAQLTTHDESSIFLTRSLDLITGHWQHFAEAFTVSVPTSDFMVKFLIDTQTECTFYFDAVKIRTEETWKEAGVIQIYPEFKNYKKITVNIKSDHRSRGGKLFSYKWADHARFEIPLSYVANSNASVINSWWAKGNPLLLKIYSGGVWETNSVSFTNRQQPLTTRPKPYGQYWNGMLELEGI